MKVFSIGELIRQRRIECNISQEELCYGICEQPTLSRIENGSTTPSRSKLTALLQRLGMTGEKYYALLSDNELEVANLQSEIMTCIVQRDSVNGLTKVEELEQIMEKDDHIIKQYILKSRVAFGKRVGDMIEKYTFEERINLLYEAIRLTVPQFEIDKISNYVLSTDEIQIISQIAKTYADEEEYPTSIIIYSRLMNYITAHLRSLSQESNLVPVSILIAYNYAGTLYYNNQFFEALTITDTGLNYSRNLRNSSYLASLLFIKAHCLFHLKHFDLSKSIFLQSYYTYLATNDYESSTHVREVIKQIFNINIDA